MRYWIAAVLAAFLAVPASGDLSIVEITEAPKALEPPIDVLEIALDGPIDEVSSATVILLTATAQPRHVKNIHVTINSTGGSLAPGLSIISALRGVGVPVVCEVTDKAQSMAAIILQSKACTKRVVQPHSVIMFHDVRSPVAAIYRAVDAERLAADLRAHSRAMAAIVAPRVGLSIKEYEFRTRGREWWVVGVDAVAQGVADEVRE